MIITRQSRDDQLLLKEAQDALKRMKAREGEDVDVWANRLAADLAKFTD